MNYPLEYVTQDPDVPVAFKQVALSTFPIGMVENEFTNSMTDYNFKTKKMFLGVLALGGRIPEPAPDQVGRWGQTVVSRMVMMKEKREDLDLTSEDVHLVYIHYYPQTMLYATDGKGFYQTN